MSDRLACLLDAWDIGMFFGYLCCLLQATLCLANSLNRGPKRALIRNTHAFMPTKSHSDDPFCTHVSSPSHVCVRAWNDAQRARDSLNRAVQFILRAIVITSSRGANELNCRTELFPRLFNGTGIGKPYLPFDLLQRSIVSLYKALFGTWISFSMSSRFHSGRVIIIAWLYIYIKLCLIIVITTEVASVDIPYFDKAATMISVRFLKVLALGRQTK